MANKLPADLEEFVTNEVASMCDATPTVLAQYIIALIGDGELNDTLKENLQEQLQEFFEDQTTPFIDRLFAKIKNSGNSSNSEPAPTSAPKESFHDFSDDEDDGDRNFKHRRQRSESREDLEQIGQKRNRYHDRDADASSSSKYHRSDDRRSNNNNNGPPSGYNNGHYDNNNNNNNNYRGGRGGGRGGRGGRGNNMNRGQRPQCRDYNEKGFCMRGDMCPYDHGTDRIIVDESGQPLPAAPFPPNMGMPGGPPQFFGMPNGPDAYDPERSGIMPNIDMASFQNMMPNMMPNMMNGMMPMNNRGNGMRRGRGGRGGRGGYGTPYGRNNNNPVNTTLTVEKIPVENCQIATVNEFFSKFGTITNISVQPNFQKAVIQYSTRAEAESAYNSPDAIFDNRFVKVYWHKDETPSSNDDAAAAAAPVAPVQLPLAPKSNEPDPELVAARAAELAKEREEKQKKHQEHMKSIVETQKKKELQLQQQIDEQKRLLEKLTNSVGMSQTEKAQLLKDLKTIQSNIDTSKNAVANDAASATKSQKEAGEVKNEPETSEDLKKKLARLEAEAANLGIHGAQGYNSSFRGGRGGYFARGRGSWPRGGGGMPRMSLDNRPTKILAKDIPQEANEADLRRHFEQYGAVSNFEKKDNAVVVQFSQRFEAEKAMAAGSNFNDASLQLGWFTEES